MYIFFNKFPYFEAQTEGIKAAVDVISPLTLSTWRLSLDMRI